MKKKLSEHGEKHKIFRDAMTNYQEHAVDTAQKMMATGDLESSKLVLRECETFIKTHSSAATP